MKEYRITQYLERIEPNYHMLLQELTFSVRKSKYYKLREEFVRAAGGFIPGVISVDETGRGVCDVISKVIGSAIILRFSIRTYLANGKFEVLHPYYFVEYPDYDYKHRPHTWLRIGDPRKEWSLDMTNAQTQCTRSWCEDHSSLSTGDMLFIPTKDENKHRLIIDGEPVPLNGNEAEDEIKKSRKSKQIGIAKQLEKMYRYLLTA